MNKYIKIVDNLNKILNIIKVNSKKKKKEEEIQPVSVKRQGSVPQSDLENYGYKK